MAAAEKYDVQALGITLSEEQLDWVKGRHRRARPQWTRRRAPRALRRPGAGGEEFDKIVSIGMIEHIGRPHLPEFAEAVKTLLKPGGLALLHTVTTPREQPFNSWMGKYIFPGAYLPTVTELTGHLQTRGMHILDVENIGPHYALTLDALDGAVRTRRPRNSGAIRRAVRADVAPLSAKFLGGFPGRRWKCIRYSSRAAPPTPSR